MTQSIIGPNAALRYLKAYNAHVDYWREVNPAFALAYVDKSEHIPYILQYASELPNSMIVARIKHDLDGGFHLAPTGENDTGYYVSSPIKYHEAYGELGRIKNVILHVMNEPNGFADSDGINRLVHWMVDYIAVAVRDKTKSVLFNWGDRNPRINAGMMDERFDICLQLMAAHPELFYMGMHFYGPDEIVSHLESYVARCERIGIVPPRVIGTEFGIDSIGGTKRGYKTWDEYKDIYGQWQVGQVKGPLQPYIKRGVLAGLTGFQEGNSGGWGDFDYENDKAYKEEIKRAALAGELQPMTSTVLTPNYQPSTFTAGGKYTLQSADGAGTNVRTAPIISMDNKIATLPDKSVVKLKSVRAISVDYWYQISTDTIQDGWVSGRGGAVSWTPFLEQPAPPETPPVVVPAPFLEVSADLCQQMIVAYTAQAAAKQKLATSYTLGAQDDLSMAQTWKAVLEQVSPKAQAA